MKTLQETYDGALVDAKLRIDALIRFGCKKFQLCARESVVLPAAFSTRPTVMLCSGEFDGIAGTCYRTLSSGQVCGRTFSFMGRMAPARGSCPVRLRSA